MFTLSVVSRVYSNMPVNKPIFFRLSGDKETPIDVKRLCYDENNEYKIIKQNKVEYSCYKTRIQFSDENTTTEYWCTENLAELSFEKKYFYFKV